MEKETEVKKRKMVKTKVDLDSDVVEHIKAVAKLADVSKSAVVNVLLASFIVAAEKINSAGDNK